MSRPGDDNPRLQIKRDGGSGAWRVSLHGVVDESFDRRAFAGLSGIIIFDFEAVNRVTSFGVLEWIKALKDLQADYYAFINCHPAVVGEFNMVENFAGRGELLTFYVPYICPQCERESEVLVSMRTHYDQVVANQLPPVYCPDDNAESELDDYPARYFAYASSRPRPAPPQMAVQIIDGQQPAGPQHLSVRKEVDGHVTTLRLSGPVKGKVPGKRLFEGLEGYVVIDMSDVTEISPQGMSKLRDAARTALSPTLYFARLSSNLLQSFQTAASDALLVSLICEIRCATCAHYFPVEVDRMAPSVGAYMSPTRCPDCQVVIPASHAAKIANALAEPLSPAPPAIMAHLRQREAPRPEAPVMPAAPTLSVQQAAQSDSMRRYERIRRIGVGGMAEVFLAQRTGPHGFRKTVVLKRMLPDIARQPRLAQMFLQEARIAALINHPNVVQIFELGQEDEGLFMVMEYVDGWDLGAVISAADRARRTIPLALCCRIVADLCAGLHAAHTTSDESGHRLGIVHRDVSPSNVLIATDGAVKLVDFGIAKVQDSFIHTQPGALKGKLSYMAPEQMLAAEDEIGPQTDMFAVGVILFECLTGRRPFVGRTEYELMQSILHHDAPKLRSLRSEAPKSLERLVARLLARNAAHRCRDAGEIVVELERMLVELKTPTVIRDVAEWVHGLPALAAQKASTKVDPDAATRRGNAAIRRGDAATRRGDGSPMAQGKKRAPTTLALDESELEFDPEGRLDGKH